MCIIFAYSSLNINIKNMLKWIHNIQIMYAIMPHTIHLLTKSERKFYEDCRY